MLGYVMVQFCLVLCVFTPTIVGFYLGTRTRAFRRWDAWVMAWIFLISLVQVVLLFAAIPAMVYISKLFSASSM